ncbi:MAG: T9SS type A sorting domain-containing protein [Flavobacteriales bacterium]|nr:T9SS type A sorting domain-containing protein [Flavobacteriales bacterium]
MKKVQPPKLSVGQLIRWRWIALVCALVVAIFAPALLNAQIQLITASNGGFEGATATFAGNGWSTAQPGITRQWQVGTAAGSVAPGTRAAYVGSTTNYNGNATLFGTTMHFYRDVVIPAGATNVQLRFSLRMPTVDNTYDYLRVYTTSTTNTPVSGTVPGAGYVQRFVNTATAYANFTTIGPINLTGVAGTTVRLVFTFTSDGATPHANPAIDDVQLSMDCILPTATFTVVENCAANNFTVNANVTSFGFGTTGTLAYSVNGGAPTNQSLTSTGTVTIGPFPSSSTVVASVSNSVPSCGATSSGSLYSGCPITIACGTPVDVQHCYGNLDTRTFTYIAPPGETVTLTFIQGTMGLGDVIRGYSGTSSAGTPIPELTGSFASLAGLSASSIGNELYLEVESNASGSCADGQQTSWHFEVKCTPACTSPDGVVVPITNCAASNYSLNVEVLSTGSEATTTLWYSVNGGPPQTMPGLAEWDVQVIGPFALTAIVNVRLLHENDATCDRNLGNFTRDQLCPPDNELCGLATQLFVKTPAQCPGEATSGSTLDAINEIAAPSCDGTGGTIRDVWYRFNSGWNQSPILISIGAGTIGHWGVEIYTGCGGALVGCVPNSPAGVNLTNASAYTDYWVRVFTNTSLGAGGTFTICVSATPQVSSCGSVIRDPGGTGNYAVNQNVTTTYCPTTPGEVLTMTFTEFNTEEGFDFVRIYDGPSTSSPLLGTFSGTTIPGPFTSTHPSGCLTVNFTSDNTINAPGYTANLSCCVAPAPTATAGNTGPACAGGSVQLNVTTNIGNTFSWTGPNGFSSALQAPTIPGITLAAAGVYTVTVRNGVNGCPTTSTTTVDVIGVPTALTTTPAGSATICNGASVPLSVSGGLYAATVTSGSGTSVTDGSSGSATMGPNPMQNYYGGTKQQMLWRASELAALGFMSGSQISSMAIDLVTADNTYALNSFRIKFQWSSTVNALTATPVSTGWTNVFPAQTVTPQTGFNTFTFTTPITWNGTDNLLIEINYSNTNFGTTGSVYNTARFFTGLSFNATSFYFVDLATPGTLNGYTMTMPHLYTGRNNVRFNATLGATCTWSPAAGLSATTGRSVTSSPTGTTTYTISTSNPGGCSGPSQTITVNVNPLPTATLNANGPFCGSGAPQLTGTLTGTGPWSVTYTTNGGSPITVSGIASSPFTINPAGPISSNTTYAITAISDANCAATTFPSSVQVVVNPPATANAGGPYVTCGTTAVGIAATANGPGSWSGGLGTFGNATDQSTTYTPALGEAGTTVTLTWTTSDPDGVGPCTSPSSNSTLDVGVPPTTATVGGPQVICANTTTTGLGGNAAMMGAASWSIVSGGSGTFSDAGDPNSTFTHTGGVGPIVLRWTISGTAPCVASSADVSVTINTTDTDGDGVIDCIDNCPALFGQNGDACNAGPNFVLGQIVNCACVGQQCTTDLIVEFQTDGNGFQNTWELRTNGTNIVVQSGGGWYPGGAVITDNTCLPDGCYHLRVFDAGGDGMANGGYILRTTSGQRIIDNRNNFNSGSLSAVINNGGFCLPLGADKLIFTSCDKLDWMNNQFLVADPNPAVSAQWQVGDQTDDGYQFWIFDPNGTYGYTKFRNHATNDGFGPPSAIRACHMQINNWSPNQIPANVLMNVKVRSRVNGTNSAWGPVCRFKLDPVRAACPLTKLMDIPAHQFYSCNVTRSWGGVNRIHARPVDGATQYQFRFNNGELAAPVVRTSSTYYVNLNWTPALPNGTYQVQVRAFKNGAWCVTSLPWGDVCNVTIVGSTAMTQNGDGTVSEGDAKLAMFPNPNRGDQLTLSLSAVEEGVNTVSVDIYDLTGAVVSSRTIAVNDGMVYQVLDLKEMASGLYMVNIIAGTRQYTERLVVGK